MHKMRVYHIFILAEQNACRKTLASTVGDLSRQPPDAEAREGGGASQERQFRNADQAISSVAEADEMQSWRATSGQGATAMDGPHVASSTPSIAQEGLVPQGMLYGKYFLTCTKLYTSISARCKCTDSPVMHLQAAEDPTAQSWLRFLTLCLASNAKQ